MFQPPLLDLEDLTWQLYSTQTHTIILTTKTLFCQRRCFLNSGQTLLTVQWLWSANVCAADFSKYRHRMPMVKRKPYWVISNTQPSHWRGATPKDSRGICKGGCGRRDCIAEEKCHKVLAPLTLRNSFLRRIWWHHASCAIFPCFYHFFITVCDH